MPLVSVVTCTYNRAHLIGQTIQSVLHQTLRDFEYLIVDDGSTDDTEKIVKSFKDSRLKYFKHERTGGHLSRLRNFAHTLCTGEFIAYIDSDDLWEASKLDRQVSVMSKNPNIGFSFTDITTFDEAGVIRPSFYHKSGTFIGSVFPAMLQNKLIICHTTLVVKRNCLVTTGPMDEQMHSGDHDLVFFLSYFFDALVIYEPLVQVRKHAQNSTGSQSLSLRLLTEHHRTLEKLLDRKMISKQDYRKSMATTSYSFGIQVSNGSDFSSATHYFLKCLTFAPWNLKAWIRLVISLTKQIVRA